MKRSSITCLQSWADELIAKADRVRNLIGPAHWLSDGHHKEELVREFLVRHLPASLRVTRGFICPTREDSRVSPEIDILVSDSEGELPWFREGGLAIIPPSAARAHLHVKTELSNAELCNVFEFVYNVYESCEFQRESRSLWSGAIFFANSNFQSATQCAELVGRALEKHRANRRDPRAGEYLPDCIAIVGGPIIVVDKVKKSGSSAAGVTIRTFDCAKLSIALLLSHLYDSISERGRELTRRGEWVQLLQQQDYTMVGQQEFVSS